MNKACFFDLDGTLIPNPSSEVRFLKILFKKVFPPASGIVMWFLESLFKYKNFKNSKAYYQGIRVSTIDALLNEYRSVLENAIPQDAMNYVFQKKNEGFKTYLITGTPHFIAEKVCQFFPFERIFPTYLEVRKGKYTGRITGIIPFGINKVKLVKQIAEQDNIDLKVSITLGDSHYDLPFLQSTGIFYAVNPSKKLKKYVDRERILIWEHKNVKN
ncbi:MAG: HAD family hydrolase [Candidatus Hydrothermia bacterium]